MFWLFFWMYAGPLLFSRYQLTSHCAFVTVGPHEDNPGWCAAELASSLGHSPSNATFHCGAVTACGFSAGCGAEQRQTPACPFFSLMPAGQKVPDSAAAAFAAAYPDGVCGAAMGGCPTLGDYEAAASHLDKAYLHEAEEDWKMVDSLIFNRCGGRAAVLGLFL